MLIEVLLVLLGVINVMTLLFVAMAADDGVNLSFLNPRVIYDGIRVNWFGAIFLAIVSNLLLPVPAVIYWFYKLCTVGR